VVPLLIIVLVARIVAVNIVRVGCMVHIVSLLVPRVVINSGVQQSPLLHNVVQMLMLVVASIKLVVHVKLM